MKIYLMLLLITCFNIVQAQTLKFEREKRIAVNDVPEKALLKSSELASLNIKSKWFEEENQNGISYELKFRYQGFKYSIEFDENGIIEDIEKNVKFKTLKDAPKKIISEHLQSKFKHFKIQKVQLQWLPKEHNILNIIIGKAILPDNLEIIVKGNRDGIYGYYEFLFNYDGAFLREDIIVDEIGTEHLEY